MVQLDVLVIGDLVYDGSGNISEAHSTSVLVRADDSVIVVDTSSPERRPHIKTSFKQLGVLPKDVDTVVLTHTHSDHIGNLDMFPKARVLVHEGEKTSSVKNAEMVKQDIEIAKGVRLVHTPGHTAGSMSVFVQGDIRYVISGDALPRKNNFTGNTPPGLNYDADLALKSIKKIGGYADMIIPGHDYPFLTGRR